MHEYDGVMGCESLELVGRSDKRQFRKGGNSPGHEQRKSWIGVETGADRCGALRQRIEISQRARHALAAMFDLCGVAGELLSERERGRILRMRPANLDDVGKLARLGIKRALQFLQRWKQPACDLLNEGNVHRGWKAIIRRLA